MSSIKHLLLLLFLGQLVACGQKGALVLEQEPRPATEEAKQQDVETQKVITEPDPIPKQEPSQESNQEPNPESDQ